MLYFQKIIMFSYSVNTQVCVINVYTTNSN